MYNSYPSQSHSAAKWIFFGFFGVVLMGFLLGANFKGATWLNRDIASAEADRIKIDNAHQQAINELQERLETAKTEAEVQQIRRDQELLNAQYQHDIQALEQDLVHRDIAFRTKMTLYTIIVGTFALMLFVNTTIWGGSKAWVYIQSNYRKEKVMANITPTMEKRIPNLPEREPYDPWEDPNYRRRMKASAKKQERK